MIEFKKIWDDVCNIVSSGKMKNINVIENFHNGFVVKEKTNNSTHFITKQDFVDFWCNMMCLNKIEKKQVLKEKDQDKKIVYEILKTLPYISEKEDRLELS
ncbi:hypothetical protein H2684_11400 [Clostridium sp. cel8]|uniref:hypothetical protein n=1 Tax=unclassified Clostridium TaxID=2614128 RepID=UPI0015F54F87|nr:hypothetical protein [Clostridium sp. cel8]